MADKCVMSKEKYEEAMESIKRIEAYCQKTIDVVSNPTYGHDKPLKKVYCGNCIFTCYSDRDWCNWHSTKSKYTGWKIEGTSSKRDLNVNGNCPHYIRKWWRFWL